MNEQHRKSRLRHLINVDYDGRQADVVARHDISKARLSQLCGDKEPFGEAAAEKLEALLDLPDGWFNHSWATPKEAAKAGIQSNQELPEETIRLLVTDAPYPGPNPLGTNEAAASFLSSWRASASAKSLEVLDQLTLLAKTNSLGDEDWQLLQQMAKRFHQKK